MTQLRSPFVLGRVGRRSVDDARMISIGVVAHVNREHLVTKLIREVDVDVISWDDGLPSVTGCVDNHIALLKKLNALSANSTHCVWCVVLEDDVRPVPKLRQQLAIALTQAETPLVGLYLGTGNVNGSTQRVIIPAVKQAEASESHWIRSPWFISAVGYAVRSAWLPSLLSGISSAGGPVDYRINEWTHRVGIETWYTQPSLVDHDDGQSLISALGTPTPRRRAYRFGSRHEWGSSTVEMGYADGWSPVV